MTVPGNIDALLLGGQRGYQIERSLRFNNPTDTVSLTRTPASAGNRRTWTWSAWVKRAGEMNGSTSGDYYQMLFTGNTAGSTDATFTAIFLYNNTLRVGGYATNWRISNALFRDPSAWYHFVVAVDTTDATANNRVRAYVNGTEITWATINNPTQNADWGINQAAAHSLGGAVSGSGQGLAGYLTEVNFIDGQALTPSSFGETDTITGVWKPKKYAGTYGTNGFYLNFKDNSSTSALGTDYSGNSNTWTTNNFSVTAGAGNDSLIDTPTPYADGGNGRGNYATLNPLDRSSSSPTLSNGNLDIKTSTRTAQNESCRGTIGVSAGKWYFECIVTPVYSVSFQAGEVGIKAVGTSLENRASDASDAFCFGVGGNGATWYKRNNFSFVSLTTSGATTGTVLSVAFDLDAGKIWVAKDGVWENSGNPASGTNAQFTSIASATYAAVVTPYSNDASNYTDFSLNFGQRAFAYTPPSGFLALNTQNLPEPSIKKPSSYMDVVTYTGTGSALTPTSSLGFSPDLVWIKSRSAATDHTLYDAVRGTEKRLESNNTDAEVTSDGGVTAFNSAGFTLGTLAQVNTNTATYCAWCWDESATPGFDIVTYTGNGAARTIAHSLGVAPSMMIIKCRSNTSDWGVYHSSLTTPATQAIFLNLTLAAESGVAAWNSTIPTSSVFSLGNSSTVNVNGATYVAYLWSEVAGFSKFGSYTGNGSSDGPFVFCGFRPKWVMMKRSSDVGGDWHLYDSARGTYNVNNFDLFPNSSSSEASGSPTYDIDFLSNGFKLRSTWAGINNSGSTFVFAAFAETPAKYALAR